MKMPRREDGSMMLFVPIIIVTSAIIVAFVSQAEMSLRASRRAGDSANALQVADAGINDAVQQVPKIAQSLSTFTRTGTVGSATFTYTATRDSANTALWHIDAVGTDAAGLKRRIQADAYGEGQFTSPMYVQNWLGVGAGSLIDSYYSGLNNTTGCTRKGVISISDGSNLTFTSGGGGNANCTGRVLDSSWKYAMDGCVVYSGTTLPPMTTAECPPPPNTYKTTKVYPTSTVEYPKEGVYSPSSGGTGDTFTCNSGNKFVAGKVYSYTKVELFDGCGINFTGLSPSEYYLKPVEVYARNVTIGKTTKGQINAPSASSCPTSTGGWTYSDVYNNPAHFYCTGWSQTLKLHVPTGQTGKVVFDGSGTQFWTLIYAPDAEVQLKKPQMEMWGAMVAGSADMKNQFSWHYDETLTSVSTGKYTVSSWREVSQ